jgi:predicted DNA-binding transcriptional regulator YafY
MQIIIAALKSERLTNASVLARQLEVSTKTIHRDIDYLRWLLGFEIVYDGSVFSYRLIPSGACPFCEAGKECLGQFNLPQLPPRS